MGSASILFPVKTTVKKVGIAVAMFDVCRDGVRMVLKKGCRMYALSDDEKSRLIELVVDDFGDCLAFNDFAAVLHGLFEDIPGLETMGAVQANRLINFMWSEYHGKTNR